MSKTVVVVLSDPKPGTDEALGRLFNALLLTAALKDRDAEVALVFQAAGTRWPALIAQPDHPANALFRAVQDKVDGISLGCAKLFGAAEQALGTGFALRDDLAVPGGDGALDLSRYLAEGYALVTF